MPENRIELVIIDPEERRKQEEAAAANAKAPAKKK